MVSDGRRARTFPSLRLIYFIFITMREIVHIQAGQCGNQIGAKVSFRWISGVQRVLRRVRRPAAPGPVVPQDPRRLPPTRIIYRLRLGLPPQIVPKVDCVTVKCPIEPAGLCCVFPCAPSAPAVRYLGPGPASRDRTCHLSGISGSNPVFFCARSAVRGC